MFFNFSKHGIVNKKNFSRVIKPFLKSHISGGDIILTSGRNIKTEKKSVKVFNNHYTNNC